MAIFLLLVISLIGTSIYLLNLRQAAQLAPRIAAPLPGAATQAVNATISVIIPAYNEAVNIRDCVASVLDRNEALSSLSVWVVDDQSTDQTWAIAHALQQERADPRLQILVGKARPPAETWRGKNWACAQGAAQAEGDYLLFLDADVRLKPGAIAAAVAVMQHEAIDLLTVIPQVECGFLGEWLVQPLIMGLLVAGFDFARVNDPADEKAFAAGPFMLFRQMTYDTIGGHRAVANQVVEDVELARLVKAKGLRLKFAVGQDIATVRMYRSWAGIWEGWTKNWYEGSRRDLGLTLFSAVVPLLVGVVPWLGIVILAAQAAIAPPSLWQTAAWGIALSGIFLQYLMRRQLEPVLGIPPRYWLLTGVGGVLTIAIILASIVKTETGWGWTWRGRSLKQ